MVLALTLISANIYTSLKFLPYAKSTVCSLSLYGLLAMALALATSTVHAFPPAPFYTIYGNVRDQYGVLLSPEGASVIIYYGGNEVLRQPLVNAGQDDYNYQARLRIDMMRLATSTYSSIAFNPGATYSLAVSIGGQLFYPFEVDTDPQIGSPAERHRLDLTLGVDSDGDGLPDAWEEAQLFYKGYTAGEAGWDLSLLDWAGDFDGDQISNGAEYLGGTYATDANIEFDLSVKEWREEYVRLEFYTLYGKTYTLKASTNLVDWTDVFFSTAEPSELSVLQTSLEAASTGVINIYTEPSGGPSTFYHLSVQ